MTQNNNDFGEFRFYRFGLKTGIANFLRNGLRLGVKKTVGKITQPINSYSRFPEYALMEQVIATRLNRLSGSRLLRVLDVGSPKCFGLYLAASMRAELDLTDISPLNLNEYRMMWEAIRGGAKGTAHFGIQDARSLQYDANEFDVVYSMSVVEHIEGLSGDIEGVKEMVRVLKPGGLLVLSIPYGNTHAEQWRKGFVRAVEKTADENLYFFQRIYNRSSVEARILETLKGFRIRHQWTIWRETRASLRVFKNLGENLQGLLGFMNPWLSRRVNRCTDEIVGEVPSSYGEIHSTTDLYGDVVIAAEKRP
ncbi:MAG TPA: class I SAM-dependent methyltransferase [Candidatus Acidoferrum sp.]|jgi:SAM-dependent methyltransferase|nr:class I SAM-dependent methyltransferase [Candidatus Acidoferrum sp.]